VAAGVVSLLSALVEMGGVDARLGQAIALLPVSPFAFVLFKRWTFRIQAPRAVCDDLRPSKRSAV